MRGLRAWSLVLVAAGGIGLAACSSSPSATPPTTKAPSTTTTTAGSTTTTTTPGSTTTTAGSLPPVADPSPAGTWGQAPTVVVPPGAPPTQLEASDLITGSGATLKEGDTFEAQYVLATYSSGKVVQSSWTSRPFTTTLDTHHLIPGWVQGMVGMKVDGRRELIIPPSLGYGGTAPGPGIAANDTLVFVVDLLKVTPG